MVFRKYKKYYQPKQKLHKIPLSKLVGSQGLYGGNLKNIEKN